MTADLEPVSHHRPIAGATPTGVGGITLLVAIVLGLISLRASNPWLLLIACALLTPVLASQLLRPDLTAISICFASADRVVVGASSKQTFHVHNRGRHSSPALQLQHSVRGFAAISLAVPALPAGGSAHLTILRPAVSRGVSLIHDIRLWTTAPFGMALHQSLISVTARINVHPAPGPIGVLPPVSAGAGGGRPNRLGEEPHEMREWRRGDSLRQVHWRATARHDRLTVVIPENTVRSRLAVVIHGPSDDEFEALLRTAAWTAVQTARSDGILRLSAAGIPDYVGDDPGAVLDWFAALESILAIGPEAVETAATWAGSSGTLVLASTRPADAAQFGRGVLVLTPDGRVARS
ncbi:MAG TPA: DUF58 domain-containing protein [Kineosporiaceae bacterium]|nr:DUF58 domain-containing protein [Kineosporiaceae bacterium]